MYLTNVILCFLLCSPVLANNEENSKTLLDVRKILNAEFLFQKKISHIAKSQVSCFISYAWGQEDEFAERLNRHLQEASIITYFDKTSIKPGQSIPDFMGKIVSANYVIAIYTPLYKQKVESDEINNVWREWGYIYYNILGTRKFIPVLYGDAQKSVPRSANYIYYIIIDDDNYYNKFFDILKHMLPEQIEELEKLQKDE